MSSIKLDRFSLHFGHAGVCLGFFSIIYAFKKTCLCSFYLNYSPLFEKSKILACQFVS